MKPNQGRLFAGEEVQPATQPDAATDPTVIAQVWQVTRAIPAGRVLSYGAVGARCDPPISGYVCGRIMIRSHHDVPWWRVVGKDGALPIIKRNPELAREQRTKLEAEGVEFDDEGRVVMERFSAELATATGHVEGRDDDAAQLNL